MARETPWTALAEAADGDRTLWQQFVEEQAAAGRAYEAAGVALDAAAGEGEGTRHRGGRDRWGVMGAAGVTPRGHETHDVHG